MGSNHLLFIFKKFVFKTSIKVKFNNIEIDVFPFPINQYGKTENPSIMSVSDKSN